MSQIVQTINYNCSVFKKVNYSSLGLNFALNTALNQC